MNLTSILVVLCAAIVPALLANIIKLDLHFPIVIAFFIVGLAAAILTSLFSPATNRKNNGSRNRSRNTGTTGSANSSAQKATNSESNTPKESGIVKWFSASKGFGFITRDNGEDIFVHFRSIAGTGHRVLREGQRVEFVVTEGDKGLQAEDVAMMKG